MKDFAKSIVCNANAQNKKTGNNIPDSQINGPSAAEIREVAGRIYKTDMREDDLARAVSFELAKKYKAFQTNTHLMDMVKEVLKKFKTGNKKVGNANKLYQDANVTIYDDGIVEMDYFRGYTQYAKDVDSIVRDEIRGLEKQITDLKKAADKVKEVGRKYKLL